MAHITRMNDQDILRYAAHTPGLVLINRFIPAMGNRCVWLNNVSAARASTEYMLRNGHAKIACITAELPIADKNSRLQGYLGAMEDASISVPQSWIISAPFTEEGGELAAEKMLSAGHFFSGVVAFNDVIAAGMMKRFHQEKIKVPEQISIIGFDDVVMARYLYPPLTTVHYPVENMAARAEKLAVLISKRETVPRLNNQFNAELVIRNSVSPR